MSQQLEFNLARVGKTVAVGHEQISDNPFAAFIHEEGVAENPSALDGGVAGKDLRVHVAQDHLLRTAVVPREQVGPDSRLVVEQRAQVHGGKVSEIENFHGGSCKLNTVFWLSCAAAELRV